MSIMRYYADGCVRWFPLKDNFNLAFRAKGPCTIQPDGVVHFSQLDPNSTSRVHGPSIIYPDGFIRFNNINGSIHRTDGPAVIYADGRKSYWVHDRKISPDEFFLKYGGALK